MMRPSFCGAVCLLTSLLCSTFLGGDLLKLHPGRLIPILDEGQRNLVPNASFECGADGWGSTERDVLPGWYGTLNGLFGQLDSSTAADGRTSLKIERTPENEPVAYNDYLHTERRPIKTPLAANIGWLAVKPGQKYTFSAAMKAAEPDVPARLVVRQFRAAPISKLVHLTTDWRRYSLQFTPMAEACYILAGPDLQQSQDNPNPPARAKVWLDAVQLVQGNAKAFAPRQPIEMGITTDKPGNVFAWGEPLSFHLSVASAEKEVCKASIEVYLTDFFDEDVWRDTISAGPFEVPPQSANEIHVTIPPAPQLRGFMRLHATLTSGKMVAQRSLRLAAIPIYQQKDSRFGLNHAFGWPEMLALSRQAGLLWMRDWSLKWQDVEPEEGRFTFAESDAQISRILPHNLKVLSVLAFPSTMWSSSAPASVPRNDPWYLTYSASPDHETQYDEILAESGSRIRRLGYAPRDMKEFQNYVRQTVAHYKGRIHDWQVFNEPIYTSYSLPQNAGYTAADYLRYVEAFVQAARESDPQCRILGGFSLGSLPRSLSEPLRFISLGGLKHVDVFTLHAYPQRNPPEYIEQALVSVGKAMQEQGIRRPIWFTEFAYYSDDDPWVEPLSALPGAYYQQASERVQAEYLVRFAVTLFAHGGEKLFFHAGTGSAINHGNLWTMFLRYGGEPFKCYASQAVLAQMLTPDCKFIKQLLPQEPIRAYLFGDTKRTVGVVWAPINTKAKQIQLTNAKLQLWDLMGRLQTSRMFTPSETPVYVVGEDVSPEDFGNALILAPAAKP
jgi:hypothetical protein